ncbi:MAG: NAD-dependent malic enzyme [Actinobacteria bacterium]|nr:NAD-dependent malic enzyme [Actinomycetota bacterium]
MSPTSASYSITLRVQLGGDPGAMGRVTTAVGEADGVVMAIDIVESKGDAMTVDITVNAVDEDHARAIRTAVEDIEDATVRSMSDRTFLLHLGGKITVESKVSVNSRDALSMAYTPGVARVCSAIAEHPEDARRLTIKRNTIAVVSDGSAVVGLGNIGATAALPVMEGKSVLFRQLAEVDAWPVVLDTHDPDEVVRFVEALSPAYGGVLLEDIAAPHCFEIERRLRESLDIPVFHNDQHAAAIVVLAALENALKVVGKRLADVRVALAGVGAAGFATARILVAEGTGDVVACDRRGILHAGRDDLDGTKRWVAEHTNRDGHRGGLRDAVRGADVLVGLSAPNILQPEDIATMADGAVVFALALPDPDVDPDGARDHAAVVATARSEDLNQINTVLAAPGVFRGALDAEARTITEAMKVAAARAIAAVVGEDELGPNYIVPSLFNPDVVPAVAKAVRQAAREDQAAGARDTGHEDVPEPA